MGGTGEIATLRKEVEALKGTIQNKDAEMSRLQTTIRDKDTLIANKDILVANLSSQIQQLQTTITELNKSQSQISDYLTVDQFIKMNHDGSLKALDGKTIWVIGYLKELNFFTFIGGKPTCVSLALHGFEYSKGTWDTIYTGSIGYALVQQIFQLFNEDKLTGSHIITVEIRVLLSSRGTADSSQPLIKIIRYN